MRSDDLKSLFGGKDLTRRHFHKLLAAAGIVAASTRSRLAYADEKQLEVFTWANYDQKEQYAPYTAKHQQAPSFSILTENDQARAKIRSGYHPDVVTPTENYVPFFVKDGLLAPIDTAKLSNWNQVLKPLRDQNVAAGPNGERYFVPWVWGTNGVVFRKDAAPEYVDNPTWNILWDPKLKGKIALRDAPNATIIPAALIAGAKDPYDLTDDELKTVGELLRKQRELVRFYWTTEAEVQQALSSGEIDAAYGWNSTYAGLKERNVPVDYLVPKEGMPIWIDGFSLVKGGTADEQLKYDYLDAVLSAETGAFNISKLYYGSSNEKSFGMVSPEILERLGFDKLDQIMKHGLWAKAVPQATLRKMVALHNRIKSGF
jgi:spermidine/putrescine transport system substrate-binding protein